MNYVLSFLFHRRASVVKTRVGSPSLHAAACANPGQRDEDERSHEHRIPPHLLTLLVMSWLEPKAPPCESSVVQSMALFSISPLLILSRHLFIFYYSIPVLLSRLEVGISLGCEVMFMKVCAEGRKTASSDWMPPINLHYAPWRRPAPDARVGSMATVPAILLSFSCTIHTTADFIQPSMVHLN